jgi:glycerol-3-phosphate acyltransferase PlsY
MAFRMVRGKCLQVWCIFLLTFFFYLLLLLRFAMLDPQAFAFFTSACMAMALIQLLSFCLLLPPILTGYQMLWVMWIILPILAISMLFSPHEDNIMLMMPGEQHKGKKGLEIAKMKQKTCKY